MREHNTENGADCWCEPKIIVEGDSRIFVHDDHKPEPLGPYPEAKCPKCGAFLTRDGKVCSYIKCDYGLNI